MKRTMKKLRSLFAFVLVCGLMTGCGSKTSETEASSEALTTEAFVTTLTTEASTSEATTEEATEEVVREDYTGKTTLTYIGHATVKIVAQDGTVLYIDPSYKSEGDAPYYDEADYIFVTHAHDDHIPCEFVKLKDGGQMITWKEALHDGIYETYDLGSIKVEAVTSGDNGNHKKEECVGYIVTVDGVVIYHAGDTSKRDWMSAFAEKNIDYAMFPIDGIYNMGPSEAAKAAELVGAKHNIPIHEYDDVISGKKKSDKFNPEGKLVLEYGETIVVAE